MINWTLLKRFICLSQRLVAIHWQNCPSTYTMNDPISNSTHVMYQLAPYVHVFLLSSTSLHVPPLPNTKWQKQYMSSKEGTTMICLPLIIDTIMYRIIHRINKMRLLQLSSFFSAFSDSIVNGIRNVLQGRHKLGQTHLLVQRLSY